MANDISPAFQWYPKDALSSIRLSMLSLAEEGAYRRALDFCWLHGSIPADPNLLIRLIGKGCTLKMAKAIIPMFEEQDGKLYHERLEQERTKQKTFREKQAENGKRGGRPKKETQEKGLGYPNVTQTEAKKSSPVSNLQSSNSIKGKEIDKENAPSILQPQGYKREWEIPFTTDFKTKLEKTAAGQQALTEIAELWETWIMVRYKVHNRKFNTDISEAQALTTFLRQSKTSLRAIESLKKMIAGESLNAFAIDEKELKKDTIIRDHLGRDVSRMG